MRPFFSTLVLLFSITITAVFVDALPTPGSRIQFFSATPTHQAFSLTETPKPVPTVPALWRYGQRDVHDDREKKSNTTEKQTKTDSKGKTVVVNVTTIVVVPGDGNKDPSKIYPKDSDHANQQDISSNENGNSSSNGVSDPNNRGNVTEQLRQDQAALKRMITILSVVGGVGAIAVVVSVLVFTRMRAKKKRKRFDAEEEALRTNGNGSRSSGRSNSYNNNNNDDNNNSDSATINSTSMSRGDPMIAASTAETAPPLMRSPSSSSAHISHIMPMPSAPPAPAPFLATLDQSNYECRQNVVSIISQTAPAPSAPSAKELDAMIELPSRQGVGPSSSSSSPAAATAAVVENSRSNGHRPASSGQEKPCPHCEQRHHHSHPHRASSTSSIDPPEAPPPAYTPSAPPIYALPPEPIVLFRRHSQG